MIRTVIVDDEPLARRRIRQLLESESDVTLIAEYGDGPSAVEGLRDHGADLLFLDIQMPEMDGFDVVEVLGLEAVGAVVFVTAHEDHALRAFDVRASDYLVKPFTRVRFHETLARVRLLLRDGLDDGGGEAARTGARDHRPPGRIPVRSGGRVRLIEVTEIDWIEASGNYAILHTGGDRHRMRTTLSGLEERLPADDFARVHRSAIVNLHRVEEVEPWSHGDYLLVLRGGAKVVVSRSYNQRIREALDL